MGLLQFPLKTLLVGISHRPQLHMLLAPWVPWITLQMPSPCPRHTSQATVQHSWLFCWACCSFWWAEDWFARKLEIICRWLLSLSYQFLLNQSCYCPSWKSHVTDFIWILFLAVWSVVVLRFGCGLYPKVSCTGDLVPCVEVLRGGGTFKRWDLEGDPQVNRTHVLRRDWGTPLSSPASCFLI